MSCAVNGKEIVNNDSLIQSSSQPLLGETPILKRESNSHYFFKDVFCGKEINLITYLARVALYIVSGIAASSGIGCIKKDYSHVFKYIVLGTVAGMVASVVQTILFEGSIYICPNGKRYCCLSENNDQYC